MGNNTYTNEDGQLEEQSGSDRRRNVSSRSDGRGFYNARDKGLAFSMVFRDANCTAGDWNATLFNDRTDGLHMVIHAVGLNAEATSEVELLQITGTAATGAVVAVPFNLNPAKFTNVAQVIAHTSPDSDASPVSGIVAAGEVDHVLIPAYGHEELRLDDMFRLGPGQGCGVRAGVLHTAGALISGVIFFFFEKG